MSRELIMPERDIANYLENAVQCESSEEKLYNEELVGILVFTSNN